MALLGETFAERTTEEWLTLLRKLEIPAAPLRTPGELFDNAHLNAVGLFETVETRNMARCAFPACPPGSRRRRGASPAARRRSASTPTKCWPNSASPNSG